MRIAAFPKGYLTEMIVDRTLSVFDWIERAGSLGVDGLELHSGFFWSGGSEDEVSRIGDALDAASFEMPMLCASPDLTHPDSDQRAREFDVEVEMIRVASTLGGPGTSCRLVSGQAHPGVSIDQGLEWVHDAIERLIPIARELDVVLAIENHYKASTWQYPEFAQRKEVFLRLLDGIAERAHFGVQFDPSNAIVAGEDSADFLEAVIDRVVTMQASDRFLASGTTLDDLRQADGTIGYSPALMHGVIGRGLNDYDRIFATLVGAGYDGWISIEDGVNGMDEMRQSAEFLRDARERWFGGSTAVRVRSRELALLAE
ncbi:sugar phosphate isomerase/epimerase family protein [Humibacter sp.]|uniref:sugar phosphate isomerase/epimerase family protein n=1 Tax=Humibacter sp. TaxID=1940291 RepID=UPI002CAA0298|nr:sugar phosphate isomerase/epimerase family protein [Humibacter sp.]HVX06729.1 sugar phosphate isomerase/epimerase family protein [Humibacter sp.]